VRVFDSSWLGALLDGAQLADAKKGVQLREARRGTPATVAELGGLVALILDVGTARTKTLRSLGVKLGTNKEGGKVWKFDPATTKLVADGSGDLHVVGFYVEPPAGIEAARSYLLGEASAVVYRASKGQGKKGAGDYSHDFTEGSGGDMPRLYFKDGFLLFRGGSYEVTEGGIVG
jgi:hypothetical protein